MSEIIPNKRPTSSQQQSPVMVILAAAMVVLLILSGIIGFFIYHNNQMAQDRIHVTATAVRLRANNHATATAVRLEHAISTALAIPGLTATAVATSPYAPFTKVLLDDPLTSANYHWNKGLGCQSSGTGYQVSDTQTHSIQYCLNTTGQYGDIAYQVTMTIHTGDCGGLVFRYHDVNNLYLFEICQDGTYNVFSHLKGVWTSPDFHMSSKIRKGLNAQNKIAITLKGDTINLYVNGRQIDTATNSDLTIATNSDGHIALFAENKEHPTSIIYTDALVWSM